MVSKDFQNEFLNCLALLSKEQKAKVMAYVESLLKPTGNSNRQALLKLAGSIDSKSIQEMRTAIDSQASIC